MEKIPQSLEAEQAVLASLVLDFDTCISGFEKLAEDDFFSPAHKIIFNTMKGLKFVDFVTLTDALQNSGRLETVGGLAYLNSMIDSLPSVASFHHYFDILKKYRVLRRLKEAGHKIIEASSGSDETAALATAEKEIFDIAKEDERRELTLLSAELPAILSKLDSIEKDPSSVRGLQTGFWGIDDRTNGLQKGELYIIAARPGIGKTSLGLNIVTNAAVRFGKKCAVFSLEMSKDNLTQRVLFSLANASGERGQKGALQTDEWKRIWLANKELVKANIFIDDSSVITPVEIMRKCMRMKREQGLDLVMIDYLGLMGGDGVRRHENRQTEVADNSRAIKVMAKELDVPVMLLSQLNRGIEQRGSGKKSENSEPQLSDLRESGAIEQDADVVMFIHKEKEKLSEESEISTKPEFEEVKLFFRKNRNGPTGLPIVLRWYGDYTTFKNSPAEQSAYDARERAKATPSVKNHPAPVGAPLQGWETKGKKTKPVPETPALV